MERDRLASELIELDGRLKRLGFALNDVAARRAQPGGADEGAERERGLVAEMDRVMTRIRAVEAKLGLLDGSGGH